MRPGGGVAAREIAHMNAGGGVAAREIAHGYAQRPGPNDLALGLGQPEEFTLCCLFDILKSFHMAQAQHSAGTGLDGSVHLHGPVQHHRVADGP